MEWLTQHWSEVLLALSALHTLVSVVVGITPTPRDDELLARAMRFVSFIRSFDELGSVKAPGSEKCG